MVCTTYHIGGPGLLAPRIWAYGHLFEGGQVVRVFFDARIIRQDGSFYDIVKGTITLRSCGWRIFIPNGGRWKGSAWRSGWQNWLTDAEYRALCYEVRKAITLLEGGRTT